MQPLRRAGDAFNRLISRRSRLVMDEGPAGLLLDEDIAGDKKAASDRLVTDDEGEIAEQKDLRFPAVNAG